jgi:hypothetical protein
MPHFGRIGFGTQTSTSKTFFNRRGITCPKLEKANKSKHHLFSVYRKLEAFGKLT